MHVAATVAPGIDKLIEQMQLVVPTSYRRRGANASAGGAGGDGVAGSVGSVGSESGAEAGTRYQSQLSSATSDVGGGVDITGWGEEMLFSFDEMREELERLREDGAASGSGAGSNSVRGLYVLPALVPKATPGLLVTETMEAVLAAILSATTATAATLTGTVLTAVETNINTQVGFCGMGGVGKTTVSNWVVRQTEVRQRFAILAWISLGQTPDVDRCLSLLYLQLTGREFASNLSAEQKEEQLKQAFAQRSVLLVLDDCWDADVAKRFIWVDEATNSKVQHHSLLSDHTCRCIWMSFAPVHLL
jgi:hypothetical protein